jgi:winged helix DNA-binding protein
VTRRPRPGPHEVLDARRLNRATLARQSLLDRAQAGVAAAEAVERFGGLQAQEPASPYLALWTRVEGFEAPALHRAFHERAIVKATLMRATLHAVSRDDYRHLLPAVRPMLRGLNRRERGGGPGPDRLMPLADAALAYAATPRSNVELREHLASLVDGEFDPDDAWWWVRRHAAFVHAPSEVAWAFGRRPSLVAAATWLEGGGFAEEADGLERVVRRHLAAFGPASAADIAAWSGLTVVRLRPAIDVVEAAGDLRRFSDERGRELLDLAAAPRPDGDVPAPPRLLPMWDSVLLAFADRTRIVSDEHRPVVVARNGDTLPTFLVDGRVAGLWWAERDGRRTRVVLEPFGRLRRDNRRALEREGERLAAFVEPLEPEVFARYRRTRARR